MQQSQTELFSEGGGGISKPLDGRVLAQTNVRRSLPQEIILPLAKMFWIQCTVEI